MWFFILLKGCDNMRHVDNVMMDKIYKHIFKVLIILLVKFILKGVYHEKNRRKCEQPH